MLTRWRREFRPERREASVAGFVPGLLVPEAGRAPATSVPACRPSAGRMEIVLGRGRSIVVDAGVDAEALGRVLAVLERR